VGGDSWACGNSKITASISPPNPSKMMGLEGDLKTRGCVKQFSM
jgi:hypothetical protein